MESKAAKNSPQAKPDRAGFDDVWIPSVCRVCSNCCGIRVHRRNGVVVKIEGNPESPHNHGKICAKGLANVFTYYDPARPGAPMVRTNPERGPGIDPKWKEISWEEALRLAAERIREVIAEDPRKLVILRGTGEADWVLSCMGSFAKATGTPNFAGGPFFATHVEACYLINGTHHVEIDVPRCDYLVLFGSQRGGVVGHDTMRAAMEIADARARGMKLVVIDPICSPMASKASEWVPIRPGTDGAMALSMLHVLVNEMGIFDRSFLAAQTNAAYLVGEDGKYIRDRGSGKPLMWDDSANCARAFDAASRPVLEGQFQVEGQSCEPAFSRLKEHLKKYAPEIVAEVTTVPSRVIRRLAREFGEAARIGSTIVIEGKEMPYRPACAFCDSRGLSSHQFGTWASISVHMLNLIVGAMDVPGGSLSTNILGPGEKPRVEESADGLVVAPGETRPYPPRRPRAPQKVNLNELFPLGRTNGTVMMGLSLVEHPHLLPYHPEVLILNNFNMMMSGVDPQMLARAVAKFRFVVFLGDKLSETAELADLFLPQLHSLERLDFPMNSMRGWVNGDHWYFTLRQPALPEATGGMHPAEIYLALAERVGVSDKFLSHLNDSLGLKESFRLTAEQRYTAAQVIERHIRSSLGAEVGLDDLKEKGFFAFPRTAVEKFPRALTRLPRAHLYFEFLLEAGRQLDSMATEAGLKLDTRGFQPLPCWYSCAAQEHAATDYDLFAVNFKLPFHTTTMTQDNPLLADLAAHHSLGYKYLLNTETAARKGIADGDEVSLETPAGRSARGIVKLSRCIHPEVIGIASSFGHWGRARKAGRRRGTHFNSLVPFCVSQMDMMAGLMDACVKVKVRTVPAQKAQCNFTRSRLRSLIHRSPQNSRPFFTERAGRAFRPLPK